MVRDFFLGFIKIHILHHAEHAPVYGVAIIAELRRHGYDLSPARSIRCCIAWSRRAISRVKSALSAARCASITPSPT